MSKKFIVGTIILEDDSDERELIDEYLREFPEIRPFFSFGTSAEVLQQLRNNKEIKVAVLDYKLSEGATGLDVLNEIRKDDPDEEIYLIIMTGFVTESILLDFLNVRPNHFIRKGDNYEHFPKMMAAIKSGKEKVLRKLTADYDRDEKIKGLLHIASEIQSQIKPYEDDRRADRGHD